MKDLDFDYLRKHLIVIANYPEVVRQYSALEHFRNVEGAAPQSQLSIFGDDVEFHRYDNIVWNLVAHPRRLQ